jgi:hypothetical protein
MWEVILSKKAQEDLEKLRNIGLFKLLECDHIMGSQFLNDLNAIALTNFNKTNRDNRPHHLSTNDDW